MEKVTLDDLDQKTKELEYLRHIVLNSVIKIEAHMRCIENLCALMSEAVDDYRSKWERD